MIRLLRRLDVPLNEMRAYIDAAAADRVEETIRQQRARLEQEQARLDAALRLIGRIDELDGMFRAAPAVELIDLPTERCLLWSGTMARAGFHESYIDLADRLATQAGLEVSLRAGREVVVLLDPTPIGLAGGDETVLRYRLCLPVDGSGRGARRRDQSTSRAAASRAACSPDCTRTAIASPTRVSSSGSPTAASYCAVRCACASCATSATRPTRRTSPRSWSGR